MNVQEAYRENRGNGVPARWALDYARREQDAPRFEWSGDVGTLERDGFQLTAKVEPDYAADLSYLGEFTNTWSADAIRVPEEMRYAPAAFKVGWEYFEPAISWAEHFRGLQAMGFPRHVADCLAREYNRRDMRAMTETETYVVTVTASRAGIELGSASLGGIDFLPKTSDRERYAYLDECAQDLMGEAIEEARANLIALKA